MPQWRRGDLSPSDFVSAKTCCPAIDAVLPKIVAMFGKDSALAVRPDHSGQGYVFGLKLGG